MVTSTEKISFKVGKDARSAFSSDVETDVSAGSVTDLGTHKHFGLWSCLAMEFSSMATWACLLITVGTSVDCGGPVGLIYGIVIVTTLNSCIALSLGEYASIMPKAGGQQLWAAKLPTARYGPVLSYYTGYLNLLGELAMSASCAFNSAQLTGASVAFTTSVVWERWMTVVLYWVYLLISLVVNFFPRYLSIFNVAGLVWLTATLIACVTVFLTKSEHKQSTEFVFTQFMNNTGWPDGFSYILGLLPIAYSMTGYDNAAHLSEELEDPEVNAPKAMVGSVAIGGFTGLVFSIIMLYCIVDYDPALNSSSDQAYIQVFVDILKSPMAGSFLCCIINVPVNLFAASSVTASSSRLAWAMACDGALPFQSFFSRLSNTKHIPVRTVILSGICQALLGSIYFISESAFYAILSIAVIALNLSYAIPIWIVWVRGRGILDDIPLEGISGLGRYGRDRRWNLGIWGWPINIISGIWPFVVSILCSFPVYIPDAGLLALDQTNWSPAVLGLFLGFATIYWFVAGRKLYKGPVTEH